MKNRTIYFVVFIISALLSANLISETLLDRATKIKGELVKAKILNQPECGKSVNKIRVGYRNNQYNVNVGKNKCINGHYKIGDKIDVIFWEEKGHAIMPYYPANFRFYLAIASFLIPIVCLYKLLQK